MDTKLRTIIISAFFEDLVDLVILEVSVKDMWTNFCVKFEGTKEVLENRKVQSFKKI